MKSTKKSFIGALLALVICFTMLVGSTLAWFTDSASVGIQTITTGNLDLTIEDGAGDTANSLEGQILTWQKKNANPGDPIWWEPGATYETNEFYIKNEGNLNLKFRIALDDFQGDLDLLNVITFDITSDLSEFTFAQQSSALSGEFDLLEGYYYPSSNTQLFPDIDIQEYPLMAGQVLGPLKVVAHMDESAGNEYMNKVLTGIGFTIIATQEVGEYDSESDDYDKDAEYPFVLKDNKADNEKIVIDNAGITLDVPANAPAGEYVMSVSNQGMSVENDQTTISFDIELSRDGVAVEAIDGVNYTVSLSVGGTLNIAKVLHKGKEVTDYDYDALTGILTFTTDSFSPFEIVLGKIEEGKHEVTEDVEHVVPEDVIWDAPLEIAEGVEFVLDLNGKTINGNVAKADGHVIKNYGKLIIKNGTIVNNCVNGGSAIYNGTTGTAIIENMTIIGAPLNYPPSFPSYAVNNYGIMTITDTVVNSNHGSICSYGEGAVATLNNVKATVRPTGEASSISSHVLYTYANGTIIVNGGEYINNAGDAGSTGGTVVCNYNEKKEAQIVINAGTFKGPTVLSEYSKGDIIVKGGNFSANVSNYLADGYIVVSNNGVYSVEKKTVSTASEFKDSANKGGKFFIDGKLTAEDIQFFGGEATKEITIVEGTISRDTASGNPVTVNTTQKVTFEDVKFESVKGSAVLATRKDGANIYLKNCEFENFASPSTGNTGFQVFAKDVTIVFDGCTFKNMPIVTSSSYAGNVKLVFTNCNFSWVGANCPGMIQLSNNVVADVSLTDCTFTIDTLTSTKNKCFITTGTMSAPGTTIAFENFTVNATTANNNGWTIVSKGGVAAGENVTVTATGKNAYTVNGTAVDFDTYLYR